MSAMYCILYFIGFIIAAKVIWDKDKTRADWERAEDKKLLANVSSAYGRVYLHQHGRWNGKKLYNPPSDRHLKVWTVAFATVWPLFLIFEGVKNVGKAIAWLFNRFIFTKTVAQRREEARQYVEEVEKFVEELSVSQTNAVLGNLMSWPTDAVDDEDELKRRTYRYLQRIYEEE